VAGCPLNDPGGTGTYSLATAKKVMGTLGCSDVFRSYDTTPTLSISTTLSRLSSILFVANTSLPPGKNDALLNGDAESLVSASLGCLIGVMRAPVSGLRPKIQDTGMSEARDVDLFFMGNREAKHRLDEVDRIVRWGRLAAPFGARVVGGTDMRLDQQLLCDHWAYEPGDTWDKRTWGQTIKQCAPARVTRGGLPLPLVSQARAASPQPATALTLAPCASPTAATATEQLIIVETPSGLWQLGDGSGRCLLLRKGNSSSDGAMVLMAGDCTSAPAFVLGPRGTLTLKGSAAQCLTANCSLRADSNATSPEAVCGSTSLLTMQRCITAGSPMQEWSMVVAVTASGSGAAESNLVLKASNWTSEPSGGANSCKFGTQHSNGITVSADGKTATDTSGGGNQVVVGSCSAAAVAEAGSDSPELSFSLRVGPLNGEAFVGVTTTTTAPHWPSEKGAWAFGSHGLGASAAGYTSSGANIDPRTGLKAVLPKWTARDVVSIAVSGAGDMSVSVNGATPVVLFKGVATDALHVAVWMSPSSLGSKFSFGGPRGVPACATATPTAKALPWVVSTRYPASGAVSVTTLARTAPRPIGYHTPLANVSQHTLMGVSSATSGSAGGGARALPPIAVFGTFGSLTLGFEPGTVGKITAVHAQDLRGESSCLQLARGHRQRLTAYRLRSLLLFAVGGHIHSCMRLRYRSAAPIARACAQVTLRWM
jgi:hypothetical protein